MRFTETFRSIADRYPQYVEGDHLGDKIRKVARTQYCIAISDEQVARIKRIVERHSDGLAQDTAIELAVRTLA